MDLQAFFKMSYGLYVLSAAFDGKQNGCIVNTAVSYTHLLCMCPAPQTLFSPIVPGRAGKVKLYVCDFRSFSQAWPLKSIQVSSLRTIGDCARI